MTDKTIEIDGLDDATKSIKLYQEALRDEMRERYFDGEDDVDSKKIPLYIEGKDDKPIPLTKEIFNYLLGKTLAEYSAERICSNPKEIAKLVVDDYFEICDGHDDYDPLSATEYNDPVSNNPDEYLGDMI